MKRFYFLLVFALIFSCEPAKKTSPTKKTTTKKQVSMPVFSPSETFFEDSVTITISTTTNGASIYYTTDDSMPTDSSTPYTTPFSIDTTTTIKAIAIKKGMLNSLVGSKTYTNIKVGQNHPTSGAYSPVNQSSWGSANWALGANYDINDATFAVYSKNATKILLEIYGTETSSTDTSGAYGKNAQYDYWMTKGSDNIWRAKLKDVPEKTYYAFRVWGPNWTFDDNWTRGNSDSGFSKDVDAHEIDLILTRFCFDPCSKEMSRP